MITVVQDNDIYKIHFHYDANVIAMLKEVPGHKWDPQHKYWTIPSDKLGWFLAKAKGTPYEYLIDVYNDEAIGENATLDDTNVIPDIDISDVDLYVENGHHLFPHQIDFMKFAIDRQNKGNCNGFILADQPGLGKSLEFANLALYNRKKYNIQHCLIIVCVNNIKYNWVSDIKKHTNGQEVPYIIGSRLKRNGTINYSTGSKEKLEDLMTGRMYGKKDGEPLPYFLIMNIEAIRMKVGRQYPIREQLTMLMNGGYIEMVAIDECHKNMSASSKNGEQILAIKQKLTRTIQWIPMTGTPITKRPTDVYIPLMLVGGHHYTSYYKWKDKFCISGSYGKNDIIGYKNINELKSWLQPNMLRRLKAKVLDLPEKLHVVEYVDNTPYQDKLYNMVIGELKQKAEEIKRAVDPRTKFIRLRQVNGSPELVDTGLPIDKNYLAKNAKLQRLLELVDDIVENGEKVVIFSNWVAPLRTVYKFLAQKYKVCCYTGTMKEDVREIHKQKFITDPDYKIIIGTIEKLGVSHTFTVANNIIFYDEPWNASDFEQCEDRCQRIGATSTINVYSLVARNTIDNYVHSVVAKKDGISKYVVDGDLDFKEHPELVDLLLKQDMLSSMELF